MRPFVFCPACATRLEPRDAEGAAPCPSCGRTWYENPAPTTGCAIVEGGRALVTIRARDPEKGRYDVPGGFLHVGEGPVEGLKREVSEELGVEVESSLGECVQAVPHVYGDDGVWTLALGFRARILSGRPRPADDVAAVHWLTPDEVREVDFAWEHDRELVLRALLDGGPPR